MDRFEKAHTVLPYKVTFEREAGGFPARVYIYNNNYLGEHDDYIKFFEKDGNIQFEYYEPGSSEPKYDTEHGYTLGASTLNFMLLSDADMPISLIEGGILLLDTVFSPVKVRIEDEKGKVIGYKQNKIHLEMPGALFIPFAPNCYLLPFGNKYTRTIEGTGEGKYSYSIISSEGLNVYLKDIPTKAGSIDVLTMAADTQSFTFQAKEKSKRFSVVIVKKIGEQSRILEIDGLQLEKDEKLLFWMDHNLDAFGLSNTEKPRSLSAQFICQRDKQDKNGISYKIPALPLKQGEYAKLTVKDWNALSQTNIQQATFSEKMLIPQQIRKELWD